MTIQNCYEFLVFNNRCKRWTWNKAMRKKINAFEYGCCRGIKKISWRDRVRNDEILQLLQTKLHFVEDTIKRKMRYAGHMLRGSSGLCLICRYWRVTWREKEKW